MRRAGETSVDVLECVTELCGEVPFLVPSGEIRSDDTIALRGREIPLIHKPAGPQEIVAAIARLALRAPEGTSYRHPRRISSKISSARLFTLSCAWMGLL